MELVFSILVASALGYMYSQTPTSKGGKNIEIRNVDQFFFSLTNM